MVELSKLLKRSLMLPLVAWDKSSSIHTPAKLWSIVVIILPALLYPSSPDPNF